MDALMRFAIEIEQPKWQPVITIPQGTELSKGRRNDWYRNITDAASLVYAQNGCYCWYSDEIVLYVGSFRPYSRNEFKSSLHGRIHNYLQNHRVNNTGRINTNLMVFNNINHQLKESDILLAHFTFDTMQIGQDSIDFNTFSVDGAFVHVVEELLICTYRRIGQCVWNRT